MQHRQVPPEIVPPELEQGAGQRLSVLAAYAARPFPSLDDAINETLELLADLIGIGLTMIHRLEGGNLVVSHACDRMGLGITTPITVPREHTFCDAVLKSLEPLVVRDADADPHWRQLPGKLLVGTRSYASVPIVLGNGHVFGTLCAHDRRVLDLGQAEIDAMRILSRLIASQIERDDALHKEADTARSLEWQNQELSGALRQLDALRGAVESISSELKIEGLLEQVLANAVVLLGAHAGAISLVGESPEAPRTFVATYNLDIEDLGRRDIPARAGLMGTIMARRGPVIVERYESVDRPLPDSAFRQLAPWIGVPIWWHDEIIGTFGIAANDPARTFGERDISVLSILARHAAVGIENAQLYAASRELGIAEERNRLAREIHDTLAQSLLTLTFQLRAARGLIAGEPERALQGMIEAEANARAALDEARRSVWNLGPASLEGGSLVEALQGEVDPRRAGVACRLVVTGSTRPLPAEIQLAMLRVTQEAIANARHHAACTRVEVLLEYKDDAVSVAIFDNGQGFDPSQARRTNEPGRGFGLAGMAERLKSVGGRLEVRSGPGYEGTTILAVAPFPAFVITPAAGREGRQQERLDKLRVVIVDDHPAIRAGLVALLEAEADLVVVGQASSGEAGLRQIATLTPDVALVDLQMPTMGGIETIARLAQMGSTTRAIVVTSFAQDELVLEALRAGAQGYLLKDASAQELTAAVRAVGRGGTYLTPRVAGTLTASLQQPERLTRRERQVLHLIGRGLADKEIASELGTSAKTAQFHVANLLDKLGAQNRTDAVRIAYARGLLVMGDG